MRPWKGFTCEQIDECTTGSHNCHENSDCIDITFGFECSCKSGHSGDGVNCEDIDECGNDPCPKNSSCVNTVGSFQCPCNDGFEQRAELCVNIDECSQGAACPAHSTCLDTPGSYECHCDQGFKARSSFHYKTIRYYSTNIILYKNSLKSDPSSSNWQVDFVLTSTSALKGVTAATLIVKNVKTWSVRSVVWKSTVKNLLRRQR